MGKTGRCRRKSAAQSLVLLSCSKMRVDHAGCFWMEQAATEAALLIAEQEQDDPVIGQATVPSGDMPQRPTESGIAARAFGNPVGVVSDTSYRQQENVGKIMPAACW